MPPHDDEYRCQIGREPAGVIPGAAAAPPPKTNPPVIDREQRQHGIPYSGAKRLDAAGGEAGRARMPISQRALGHGLMSQW
jgi:hypothetical protein